MFGLHLPRHGPLTETKAGTQTRQEPEGTELKGHGQVLLAPSLLVACSACLSYRTQGRPPQRGWDGNYPRWGSFFYETLNRFQMALRAELLFPGPWTLVPGSGGTARCRFIVLQSEELWEGLTGKGTVLGVAYGKGVPE